LFYYIFWHHCLLNFFILFKFSNRGKISFVIFVTLGQNCRAIILHFFNIIIHLFGPQFFSLASFDLHVLIFFFSHEIIDFPFASTLQLTQIFKILMHWQKHAFTILLYFQLFFAIIFLFDLFSLVEIIHSQILWVKLFLFDQRKSRRLGYTAGIIIEIETICAVSTVCLWFYLFFLFEIEIDHHGNLIFFVLYIIHFDIFVCYFL